MSQPPQRARRNRQDGTTIVKSFSCPRDLAEAIVMAAKEEEHHNNQSSVIISALIEYLNRRYDVRAA